MGEIGEVVVWGCRRCGCIAEGRRAGGLKADGWQQAGGWMELARWGVSLWGSSAPVGGRQEPW